MICPICGAFRPTEVHLDWCDYDGEEPEDDEERLFESHYAEEAEREANG